MWGASLLKGLNGAMQATASHLGSWSNRGCTESWGYSIDGAPKNSTCDYCGTLFAPFPSGAVGVPGCILGERDVLGRGAQAGVRPKP